jgi:hypothetical protein
MNRILMMLVAIACTSMSVSAFATSQLFTLPGCLQDQYGNQYQNLHLDREHHVVTGKVVAASCTDHPWTMVGSWANQRGSTILELSVANSDATRNCVPIYKLKGPYPTANWYYDDGFHLNQEFKYAECGTDPPTLPDTDIGSPRGMKRSR